MINLYFVRHGQTEWNSIRKLQGTMNSPLTKEGVQQTLLLKDNLPKVDRCITSLLGRAVETAELLCDKSVEIEQTGLIAEMSFGDIEGVEKEKFKERFPEEFFNLWHHADLYDSTPFHGESFDSVIQRGEEFLESLKQYKNESILIVSHGMMLKVLFGLIWKHDLSQFWNDPVPLNTSITQVTLENSSFEIVDFSNISHLPTTEVISYV